MKISRPIFHYSRFLIFPLAVATLASCHLFEGHDSTGPQPLVDQTVRLNSKLVDAHIQIVPRQTTVSGDKITGTFDLVVYVDHAPEQRVDLGQLIGTGGSDSLTFQNKKTTLTFQDLNHDGTLDTNVLHNAEGYALISFDKVGRPYRLKFADTPTGGYAKLGSQSATSALSTDEFTLRPHGFRYLTTNSQKIDASWNKQEKVFELDI